MSKSLSVLLAISIIVVSSSNLSVERNLTKEEEAKVTKDNKFHSQLRMEWKVLLLATWGRFKDIIKVYIILNALAVATPNIELHSLVYRSAIHMVQNLFFCKSVMKTQAC